MDNPYTAFYSYIIDGTNFHIFHYKLVKTNEVYTNNYHIVCYEIIIQMTKVIHYEYNSGNVVKKLELCDGIDDDIKQVEYSPSTDSSEGIENVHSYSSLYNQILDKTCGAVNLPDINELIIQYVIKPELDQRHLILNGI